MSFADFSIGLFMFFSFSEVFAYQENQHCVFEICGILYICVCVCVSVYTHTHTQSLYFRFSFSHSKILNFYITSSIYLSLRDFSVMSLGLLCHTQKGLPHSKVAIFSHLTSSSLTQQAEKSFQCLNMIMLLPCSEILNGFSFSSTK